MPLKIMIVEDEKNVREELRLLLESASYGVCAAYYIVSYVGFVQGGARTSPLVGDAAVGVCDGPQA